MSQLVPCPCCNRHVRIGEAGCPFCACALPNRAAAAPRPNAPTGRLSRAAMVAAGALLGATAGCGPTAVPVYGAPIPADAGGDTSTQDSSGDTAKADDAQADSAEGGGGGDSGNATTDAAGDGAANDRGVQVLYGAPVQPAR
ncbi:MAG: hypothetical protein ABUS79_10690 [Pseudomonadota bacterium]